MSVPVVVTDCDSQLPLIVRKSIKPDELILTAAVPEITVPGSPATPLTMTFDSGGAGAEPP